MDNGHISKIRSKSNRTGRPRRHGRKTGFANKRRPQNKSNNSRASSKKEGQKGDKWHSTNKIPDSDQKQIVSNSPKDQTKKRRPYNSRKQNSRHSSKQGVDDNRKKIYENKSRTNNENSKNSERRQYIQKDSGNVKRDNNSDSHKVREVDGNRLDLLNDGQEK